MLFTSQKEHPLYNDRDYASNKLDRSNIPNPTSLINKVTTSTDSAVSALSSQASSFQSLTDARGAGTRIQDVVPNFEVLASGGVAFEKASAVLQPTVDTVKEEVSTVELNKKLEETSLITLHLGNGASACAVKNGKSIDTSLGMSTITGLVMGTRVGDIDPGVIIYMQESSHQVFNRTINVLRDKQMITG